MTDARELRVGHREREATIVLLRGASSEGRLTEAELAQRVAAALEARTFGDLDSLVADLPVGRPSATLVQAAAYDPALVGMDSDHRRAISGGMSSHKEYGVWYVPPFLALSAGMGSVRVDFSQAICPHPVVDIAVSGGVGSVRLVVPEGWGVNTDQVGKGMGSVSNKIDAIPQQGFPLLVLHGSSGIGSISVKGPNWFDRRRLRRAQRATGTRTSVGPGTSVPGALPASGPAQSNAGPRRPGAAAPAQDASPQDAPWPPRAES